MTKFDFAQAPQILAAKIRELHLATGLCLDQIWRRLEERHGKSKGTREKGAR